MNVTEDLVRAELELDTRRLGSNPEAAADGPGRRLHREKLLEGQVDATGIDCVTIIQGEEARSAHGDTRCVVQEFSHAHSVRDFYETADDAVARVSDQRCLRHELSGACRQHLAVVRTE